ncbi:MAG: hypothetical protein HRF40_01300, partial [Nitrososphaera sp.]
ELPILEKYQLIYNSRKIGKTNMYRLNTDFRAVSLLEQFTLEMAQVLAGHDGKNDYEDSNQAEMNTADIVE